MVTRYFGGVLLGAGGLVRAYTRGAKDAVDAARIKVMALADMLEISVEYSLYGRLPQVFAAHDVRVISEDFADSVRISLFVREELAESLTNKLIDCCNGKISVENKQKEWFDFA